MSFAVDEQGMDCNLKTVGLIFLELFCRGLKKSDFL